MGGWTGQGKDTINWDGKICAKSFCGDGSELTGLGAGLWEVDGGDTELITADDIDMQSKDVKNVKDLVASNQVLAYLNSNSYILLDATTNTGLIVKKYPTTNMKGMYTLLQPSPTSDGTEDFYALDFVSTLATDYNIRHIYGIRGYAGLVDGDGTAQVTSATGIEPRIYAYSALGGKITTGYGIHVLSPIAIFTTMDDYYGLKIDNAKDTDITNAYAIHTGNGLCHFGDDVEIVGDLTFTTEGGGLPFGACYGNHIGINIPTATQNLWYAISSGGIVSGELNAVTQSNGVLTFTKAGKYLINYSCCFEDSVANDHIEVGASGAATSAILPQGQAHLENKFASEEEHASSTLIADIPTNGKIELMIRTTDVGTPNINIQAVNITAVQIGGT